MFNNIPVHMVRLSGVYNTVDEIPHTTKGYGDHRSGGSPLINGATQKMIDVVKSIDKQKLTVVDFGGGNGKMYSTLKQETDKSFDYKIVELPKVSNDLGDEVTYYTSIDQITGPVDILFSDATIYATGDPVSANVNNFCSIRADYIVLNRSMLFFHPKEGSDFAVKSFYTWVEKQNFYYNLVELAEYEKYFKSSGYEIVKKTYSGFMDESPPRQVFCLGARYADDPLITYLAEVDETPPAVVEGRKIDDPVITYFDHVFKRSE